MLEEEEVCVRIKDDPFEEVHPQMEQFNHGDEVLPLLEVSGIGVDTAHEDVEGLWIDDQDSRFIHNVQFIPHDSVEDEILNIRGRGGLSFDERMGGEVVKAKILLTHLGVDSLKGGIEEIGTERREVGFQLGLVELIKEGGLSESWKG